MDDKKKQLTFEEYLAKYPELMGAKTQEEFEAMLANLPEDVPHELWSIIEPTIVNKEDLEHDIPPHTSGKEHDEKHRVHAEHSTHRTKDEVKHIEDHVDYQRIKNEKKQEWLRKHHVLGLGEESDEWKRYSTNLEFDLNHPVDKLFPFKKVYSDFEVDARQDFFRLHPDLEEPLTKAEAARRYNNPLEDPLYLGAMLDAKENTRAWYNRQVAQGEKPTATQIEHQFSIEKAKSAASFQNNHPQKAEIYKEQFGTIAQAADAARKVVDEATSEKTDESKPTPGPQETPLKPREYMEELFADKRVEEVEAELQSEWRAKFQNVQDELLLEKKKEYEEKYKGQYYYDREAGFRITMAEYMLEEFEHGKRGQRQLGRETDLVREANERLQQKYGRKWHHEVRRVIYKDKIPVSTIVTWKAGVTLTNQEIEQRFKEKYAEDYERYAAIQRSYDKGQSANLPTPTSTAAAITGIQGSEEIEDTDVSDEDRPSYDTTFSNTVGAPPNPAATRFERRLPPLTSPTNGENETRSSRENTQSSQPEQSDDSGRERRQQEDPVTRARRARQRARQTQQSIQRARQRIQRARQFGQNAKKIQTIAKMVRGITTLTEGLSTIEIWGPVALVIILILLLAFGQDLSGSALPGTRNSEVIDDRTLPKVQIVKEGPEEVPVPTSPDGSRDFSNVIVEYKLRVSYQGIAEDVVIDEPIPEGAEFVENGTTAPFKKLDENGDTLRANSNPANVRIIEWSLKDIQNPARTITQPPGQVKDIFIYTRSPYFLPTPSGDSDTSYSPQDLGRLNELGGRVAKYQSYLRNLSPNVDQQYTDPFLSVIWSGAIEKNGGKTYYWRCGSQIVTFSTGCPTGFSSGQLFVAHGIQVNKANTFLNNVFENVYGVDAAVNPARVKEIGQRVIDLSGSEPLGPIKDTAGQPLIFPLKTVAELTYAAQNGDAQAQQAVAILLMDPEIAAAEVGRMIALDIARTNNWAQALQTLGRNDLQAYANRTKTIAQQYAGNIVGTFRDETITVRMKAKRNMWIPNKAVATAIGAQRRETRTIGQLPNAETCNGFYQEFRNPIRKNFGDPECNFKRNKDFVRNQLEFNLGAGNSDINKWFAVIIPCESGYDANAYAGHAEVGTPDPGGAWGLFQMGSCVNAPGTACDGKNGQYDKGDVPWDTQIFNAVQYNKILANNRKKWQYWACARQYWGE